VSGVPAAATSEPFDPAGRSAVTRARLLAAFACLFFLFEQLPYFQTRWIEDESSYSDAAWTFAHEGRIRMSMYPPIDIGSVVDVRPPAMPIALGAAFRAVGMGVWQARLLPLLFGLGTIVLTYLLGTQLAGRWAGAIAACLVATDNVLFVSARTTRPEAIVTFLDVLAFLLFLHAMRRNSWWLALGAGLSAGIAMNFHINGVIAPLAMALWALYEYGVSVVRRPVAWVFAVVVLLSMAPYVIWVNADPVHRQAYREMQALGTEVQQASSRFQGELMRYRDFLGIANAKISLPVRIPMRAPLAMVIIAGLVVLFRQNRKVFWSLALLLAACMGWWYYLANKNVRYTVVASPVFAIIVGAAAVAFATTKRRRWLAYAACGLFVLNQVAGNAFLVYRFHNADYVGLTRQLREAIPAGTTVYGANTFWLALHDRHYYSFDRSPFDYAIANLKPNYLILYDRVMQHGSGFGADDFAEVRTKATEFVRTHAEKTAAISNPFYGDLEIYRVRY
jgi:4-amino-4-deoxy-L-arabinose transferase-like glycosyltransferase